MYISLGDMIGDIGDMSNIFGDMIGDVGDLYLVYLYNMVIFHSELLVYHDLYRMAPPPVIS